MAGDPVAAPMPISRITGTIAASPARIWAANCVGSRRTPRPTASPTVGRSPSPSIVSTAIAPTDWIRLRSSSAHQYWP